MQSLPGSRCSTAAKIPTEVILEKIYSRSCRLETAIERLLPSCDLYEDSDPAAYIKLCSGALLACKNGGLQVLFESQITPSQALSAISVLPGCSSTLDWNDQAPIRSVLGAVPTEVRFSTKLLIKLQLTLLIIIRFWLSFHVQKFTVDLRLSRKRPPFYEFLADIGFEILNERSVSWARFCSNMHNNYFHYPVQDWEWFATAPLDVLLHIHSTGERLLPANYRYSWTI